MFFMAIPGLNQWNFAGALQNLPNNMMERMSSIATRVALAAMAARVGLWAARIGLSGLGQVCPERLPCQEPADSIRSGGKTALVDPENPPFGWEADPSKRETALVDLANPPVGWESPTQLCNPQPQTNFCKAFHAGMNYAEGIVSTISEKANTALGNLYYLRNALSAVIWVINWTARRV
jgi:hypothetical protein